MKELFYLLCINLFSAASTVQEPSVPVSVLSKEMSVVPDTVAAKVPPGYKAEVFMQDLSWSTSVDFDESGNVFVAEAGYVYGDPFAAARSFRISPDGQLNLFADGFLGPITDIIWHQCTLYVSHRGKISTVSSNGAVKDLVTDLPSYGDHFNNQMTLGPDNKIYFGQGVATNSGVVGLDNAYPYIWILLWPNVHDIPAKDIKLSRESFLLHSPATYWPAREIC